MEADIKHVGLHAYRLADDPHGREAAFAEEWAKEQAKPPMLAMMIHSEKADDAWATFGRNYYPERLTQREAEIAATVVQWLGSPVGFTFVEKCIERCGYVLRRKPE